MKFSLLIALFLAFTSLYAVEVEQVDNITVYTPKTNPKVNKVAPPAPIEIIQPAKQVKNIGDCSSQQFLAENSCVRVSVLGQGVAPVNTASPAQAYALAKRAAIADSYRLIAEKIKGVNVDGHDLIKNMMVKRSSIRTSVNALVRNANITETVFKDGLCEVEMEIVIYHSQFL